MTNSRVKNCLRDRLYIRVKIPFTTNSIYKLKNYLHKQLYIRVKKKYLNDQLYFRGKGLFTILRVFFIFFF